MRVRLLLIPLVAAAALLAGCSSTSPSATPTPTTNGYENKSADEILQAATDALTAAKSFRIKGSADVDGAKTDLDLVFAGSNVQGTISEKGADVQLLKVGSDSYIKAGDDFLTQFVSDPTQLAAAKAFISGKWMKLPASSSDSILPKAADLLKPETGSYTKGDVVTTADGTKAIALKVSDGELHVSLVGKPYPLELVGTDGSKATFSDFDKDVTIAAPAAAEVVDLSALISSLG